MLGITIKLKMHFLTHLPLPSRILRDKSFSKMTGQDWDLVLKVHLDGAFKVTRAAWTVFQQQNYGRIIMTTSAAGLYGNYGQANYASGTLYDFPV